jgi:integrase
VTAIPSKPRLFGSVAASPGRSVWLLGDFTPGSGTSGICEKSGRDSGKGRGRRNGVAWETGLRRSDLWALRLEHIAVERDPVCARPLGHGCDRLATFKRLGCCVVHGSVADRVPLLRQNDDVGPSCRRLCDEALCLLEVRALVGPTRHLNARDADPVRHTRRIASPRWSQ